MDFNAFGLGAALAALVFLLFFYMGKARKLEQEKEELLEKLEFISKVAYELKEQLDDKEEK